MDLNFLVSPTFCCIRSRVRSGRIVLPGGVDLYFLVSPAFCCVSSPFSSGRIDCGGLGSRGDATPGGIIGVAVWCWLRWGVFSPGWHLVFEGPGCFPLNPPSGRRCFFKVPFGARVRVEPLFYNPFPREGSLSTLLFVWFRFPCSFPTCLFLLVGAWVLWFFPKDALVVFLFFDLLFSCSVWVTPFRTPLAMPSGMVGWLLWRCGVGAYMLQPI